MPEMIFQEIAAKVAVGFFSQIKIFENTVFVHVTEVPTSRAKEFRYAVFFMKINPKC